MPNREELLTQLVEMLEQAQQTANQANEQRLRRLVGTYDSEAGQYQGGMFEQFGQIAAEDVEQSAVRQRGRQRQSLISRGLGNTTILGTMQRGVEEDKLRALRDIEERVTRSRAGVLEGVTDAGPNMGQTASLIQQLASVPDTNRNVTVGQPARTSGPSFGQPGGGGAGGGGGSGGGPSFTGATGGTGAGSGASTYYPNRGGGDSSGGGANQASVSFPNRGGATEVSGSKDRGATGVGPAGTPLRSARNQYSQSQIDWAKRIDNYGSVKSMGLDPDVVARKNRILGKG